MNQTTSAASDSGDELLFVDETGDQAGVERPTWKVMIADDEPDVHVATKFVLKEFSFQGRGLQFLDAYSGKEACEMLAQNPDTAVVFLDVVMETDDAGLIAVRRIRDELDNQMLRIILRTGQPGHAPEEEVVLNYHINDYKAKSEMTAKKLFTSMVAALRSFQDMQTIEANRRGLAKILEASTSMDFRSRSLFVSGLLTQLASLLEMGDSDMLLVRRGEGGSEDKVLAACGLFEPFIGEPVKDVLSQDDAGELLRVFDTRNNFVSDARSIYLIPVAGGREVAVYAAAARRLSEAELSLMMMFCQKILVAFENFEAVEQSRFDQNAEIALLVKLTNRIHDEPVAYANNLGWLCHDMVRQMLEDNPAEMADSRLPETIQRAAMLADVGNSVIPAEVFQTPGPLSAAQMTQVRTHAERGASLVDEALARVKGGKVAALARQIALAHHENFDGSGYPGRLSGSAIPLAGRVVAVADSYMALTSKRPWRDAFPHDEAVAMIRQDAGKKFDPAVVAAFAKVSGNYRQAG